MLFRTLLFREFHIVNTKFAAISGLAALALIAAPMSPASAHGFRHGGLIFGLAALGAAAVVGVATIVTAPIRVLAAPPVYAPQPVYAQPQGYYAPPQGYYAPPPAYYAPPQGYYYGR